MDRNENPSIIINPCSFYMNVLEGGNLEGTNQAIPTHNNKPESSSHSSSLPGMPFQIIYIKGKMTVNPITLTKMTLNSFLYAFSFATSVYSIPDMIYLVITYKGKMPTGNNKTVFASRWK